VLDGFVWRRKSNPHVSFARAGAAGQERPD
jgi:hypothetical protein